MSADFFSTFYPQNSAFLCICVIRVRNLIQDIKLFRENFGFKINQDFDLMKLISHPLVKGSYDLKNKQLISKHSGNRKPKLSVSFTTMQTNESKQLNIEIRLLPVLRRLMNLSIVVSVLIGLLVFTHLVIYEIPIIAELEQKIRMIIYAYPLLAIFTLGIYYLAFMQEVISFKRLFIQLANRTST